MSVLTVLFFADEPDAFLLKWILHNDSSQEKKNKMYKLQQLNACHLAFPYGVYIVRNNIKTSGRKPMEVLLANVGQFII